MRLTVIDKGDINLAYYNIDSPLGADAGLETIIDFAKEVYDLYYQWCDGRCEVTFEQGGLTHCVSKRQIFNKKIRKSETFWDIHNWVTGMD